MYSLSALTEFLTARLNEDEAAARSASPGPWLQPTDASDDAVLYPGVWSHPGKDWVVEPNDPLDREAARRDATHIARHDPARVLREVEAKRAILVDLEPTTDQDPDTMYVWQAALGYLAAAYAEHPDYRPEWRLT